MIGLVIAVAVVVGVLGCIAVFVEVLASHLAEVEDVLDLHRKAIRALSNRVEQLEYHALRHHETVSTN